MSLYVLDGPVTHGTGDFINMENGGGFLLFFAIRAIAFDVFPIFKELRHKNNWVRALGGSRLKASSNCFTASLYFSSSYLTRAEQSFILNGNAG